MKPWIAYSTMSLFFIVLAVLFSFPELLFQPHFVHRDGKYLVAADGKRLQLRGINLGNWLVPEGYMFGFKDGPQSPREIDALVNELIGPEKAERFWTQYTDTYVTEDDIRFLHESGFNSIRVPLSYKSLTGGFALLDRLVGWAEKYKIYVIFDLHCAPGGQTGSNIDDSWGYPWLYTSPEAQERTIDTWKKIASHYRKNSTVLGYDLLNEPITSDSELQQYNEALEPLYKRITSSIREVDKRHLIILGGAQWDSNFKVFGPPFDDNVLYTFHTYWTPPTKDVIQPYLDFRDLYNVPIYLGESGENNDDWIRRFVTVLESEDIGWTFWPYKKMEGTSSVVAWHEPFYWKEIVTFATKRSTKDSIEKHFAARPSQEHAQAAFDDLIEKIRFSQCRVNAGYLHALGLAPPTHF